MDAERVEWIRLLMGRVNASMRDLKRMSAAARLRTKSRRPAEGIKSARPEPKKRHRPLSIVELNERQRQHLWRGSEPLSYVHELGRECLRCGEYYPWRDPQTGKETFQKNAKGPYGFRSICKLCTNSNRERRRLELGEIKFIRLWRDRRR